MKKRILSILLTLVMVIGMLPTVAFAATPTVTWNNQTFSTQQELDDNTVLELVGENTINIAGEIVPDHNDDYYGIDGSTNLTIQGNGTLTINMKNITVPSGYDIDRLELIGLQATNLTIEGNVTIVINIESAALSITGISGRTISVEDAANLDITVANTRNGCDATGIYASRWASLTSTGTTKVNVSVNSTTTYELGDGILVDGIDVNEENNGNLTIKNGTVNVAFDNNAAGGFGFFGAAIKSDSMGEGSLLIEKAKVNTTVSNNGKQQFAIEEGSKAKATNTNTLVVKNSTLNLGGLGLNGGLISANNGMHLDNSTVTVNCQINNAGHALQAHSLKISGGKIVSLTTYGQYPVWVSPYYGYIEFDLTEGGKFIAMGTQTGTYDMNYVKLGADNNVTSGSVDYTNNYNSDTTIGFATAANNKFVVEYGSTGSGETPEPNNVNVEVTAPVAGEYPNSSATIDNAGFTIEEIRWCDNANGFATLDGSVPFVGGNKYQCVVFLEAKEGYDLDSIEKVTINGNTAMYGTAGSAKYYYYDFTATGGVAPSITGITIDPTSAEVTKGNTQQFTATVTGEGEFDDSVQWSVSGGTASTIDANGLLTVGAGETATELTVIAKAAADTTKTATATVTVAVPNVITATVTDINVTGTVDTDITVQEFRIYVDGDTFGMSIPANITDWFKNIPTGLIVEKIECAGARLTVRVSGTPTVASDKVMQIVIPADALTNSDSALTVDTNANAKFNIVNGETPPTEYTVTLPTGTGFSAAAADGSASPVVEGGSYSFTVTIASGYKKGADFAVKANGTKLTEASGKYTITNITENQVITVEGVVENTPVDPEKTATPEITYNAETFTVTATGNGTVKLYKDGVEVSKPCELTQTDAETTYTFTATAQEEGKLISETATKSVTVPAKVVTPEPAQKYTITYTDGVVGKEIFADVVFTDVEEGSATPTISNPTRSGYTFTGWTPAVAATVTGDQTYTATWDKNSTGGGIVIPTVFPVTVKESDNGEVEASAKYAVPGSTVKLTVTPDEGYELDTLTVKSGSKFIDATEKNGKYQFVMPFGSVTVTATFKKIETPVVPDPVVPSFDDVAEDTYYFDAVEWAVENGITTGTSDTTFSPDLTCTRAQAVTFLWRAAGSPEPKSNVMPFEDVAAEAYYYKAVLWAVENGITKGTSATTFSPDADCTRAQIVTFLWRAQKSPAAIGVNPFTDVAADAYYVDAVLWAVEEKVTNGTSATTFSPDADCTRAQIVTFLYRALNEQ